MVGACGVNFIDSRAKYCNSPWPRSMQKWSSPTPDPKEREKGFVRRECARHHTVDLTKRENELYSWQNFPFWCAASHHYVRTYCIVGKIIYRPHSSMLTVLSPLNFTSRF